MQIATGTQTTPANRNSATTTMVIVVLFTLVGVATVYIQDGRAQVLCKIQLELIQKILPK